MSWVLVRRFVAVTALAAVSLVAACDSDVKIEPPAQEELSVLHYNVHQGKANRVMDVLASQVARERPDVVTLNEVCMGDYGNLEEEEGLVSQLRKKGYTGRFAETHSTLGCGVNSPHQGVAVFVKGDPIADSDVEDSPDIGQATACLTREGDTPLAACATHLTAGHEGDPEAESAQLQEAMTELSQRMPVVFAGDLNLDPWNKAMSDLNDDFYELDKEDTACGTSDDDRPQSDPPESCTFKHDDLGWRKLDYIFVDKQHFNPEVQAETSSPKDCGTDGDDWCSDHRQYRGTATFKSAEEPSDQRAPDLSGDLGWKMWIPEDEDIDCEGPDPADIDDPTYCNNPQWNGRLEAVKDDQVSGEGELRLVQRRCNPNIATQEVSVTGGYNSTEGHFDISLEFDTAEIEPKWFVCESSDDDADSAVWADWADQLGDDINFDSLVSGSVAFETPQEITVDDKTYMFGICQIREGDGGCHFS